MTVTRGTTNSNDRGSSYSRRRRREWLVETYRADQVLVDITDRNTGEAFLNCAHYAPADGLVRLQDEAGRDCVVKPACRCYRCGTLLTVETVTVDRIIPGCMGGTYRRDNIRPACLTCNSSTGGALSRRKAS